MSSEYIESYGLNLQQIKNKGHRLSTSKTSWTVVSKTKDLFEVIFVWMEILKSVTFM